MVRCVIAGGGRAGAFVATTMREAGFDGEIVLCAEEEHLPYDRPPLSKELLRGREDAVHEPLFGREQYAASGIDLCLGERVTGIDRSARVVRTGRDREFGYDALVLATGAVSRKIGVPGGDLHNVRYLRTVDDAYTLRGALSHARNLVIVGGGLIGLEVASVARALAVNVTVVETRTRVLERVLDGEAAAIVGQCHESHGVSFVFSRTVRRFLGSQDVTAVELDDGTTLPADVVLIAIGVVPATGLAISAGLEAEDGIVVNQWGQTSDERIYAVGDVARFHHPVFGMHLRCETWQSASEQAEAVARHLCGQQSDYMAVPWCWSDQYDLKIQVAGIWAGHDHAEWVGEVTEHSACRHFHLNGRLIGAIGINRPRDIAMALRKIAASAAGK